MGSGSSRPNSKEAEKKDPDIYKPVKNWEGETVGWVERTESDKLRRKQLKNPPPKIKKDSPSKIPQRKQSKQQSPPPRDYGRPWSNSTMTKGRIGSGKSIYSRISDGSDSDPYDSYNSEDDDDDDGEMRWGQTRQRKASRSHSRSRNSSPDRGRRSKSPESPQRRKKNSLNVSSSRFVTHCRGSIRCRNFRSTIATTEFRGEIRSRRAEVREATEAGTVSTTKTTRMTTTTSFRRRPRETRTVDIAEEVTAAKRRAV